jgi:hypothetical protein
MDKDALRALRGAGDLTLDQLRAQNPRAADSLAAAVVASDRTRIAERIRGSVPSHIQIEVAEMEIDLHRDDVVEHVRGRLVTLGIDPQTASSAAGCEPIG